MPRWKASIAGAAALLAVLCLAEFPEAAPRAAAGATIQPAQNS